MIIRITIAWIITIGMGYGLVYALWPTRCSTTRQKLFLLCTATGLGLGIGSCVHLAALVVQTILPNALIVLDLSILLIVWCVLIRCGQWRRRLPFAIVNNPESRILSWFATVTLAATLVIAGFGWYWVAVEFPHGQWDAFAIWNLKARHIALGGENWSNVFNDALKHTDYPLLLPLSIARMWTYAGTTTTAVPQLLHVVFLLLTISVLLATVAIMRNRIHAIVATFIVMAYSNFLRFPSNQYADTAVGCYILMALCMTVIAWRLTGNSHSPWVLSGLFAGCAAWTKNEGLLFALVLVIVTVSVTALVRGPKKIKHTIVPLLTGLAPFLFIVGFFKLTLTGSNDLLQDLSLADIWNKITDPQRHQLILRKSRFIITSYPDLWVILSLLVYLGIFGFTKFRQDRPGIAIVGLSVFLTTIGYYTVYLITPHDLSWHLSTSLQRLFIHLWPSGVLCVVLAIKSPQAIIDRVHLQRA